MGGVGVGGWWVVGEVGGGEVCVWGGGGGGWGGWVGGWRGDRRDGSEGKSREEDRERIGTSLCPSASPLDPHGLRHRGIGHGPSTLVD